MNPTHHHHDHHHHHHDHGRVAGRTLLLALGLTLLFALVEAVGGWWSGSLALLGDAGHMLSDAFSLGLAAFAALLAARPATTRLSYGYGRVEVLAALVNVLLMFAVVTLIVIEAWQRIATPRPVTGTTVLLVALFGLGVNLLVAWILHRGEQTLNTRAALLHVIGDLFGSLAAVVSGSVILLTGWTPIDPLLSLLICALILYSSVRLLRETINLILEGVPGHIDLEEVGRAMAASNPAVQSVHDLHIWAVSSGEVMLSAHVNIGELAQWPQIHAGLDALLHERFGIDHLTLQPVATGGTIPLAALRR